MVANILFAAFLTFIAAQMAWRAIAVHRTRRAAAREPRAAQGRR